MRRIFYSIPFVFLTFLLTSAPWIVRTAHAQTFTLADIQGTYALVLSGFITFSLPDGSTPTVPTRSVGLFTADGQGNATVTSTQNVGGFTILGQQGTATYTVNPDGSGTSSATIQNVDVEVIIPPPLGIDLPSSITATFSFVIKDSDEILLAVTSLRDAQTGTPLAAINSGGSAARQIAPQANTGP